MNPTVAGSEEHARTAALAIKVSAELARAGRTKEAMAVRDVAIVARQSWCDHSQGTREHLTMGGTLTLCKGCGLEREP